MFESTFIIGMKQYSVARQLFDSAFNKVSGPIAFAHQFINMENQTVQTAQGPVQTCKAAMGQQFAAGTTDGPGVFDFSQQGTPLGQNPFYDLARDVVVPATPDLIICQNPKPILLATGEYKLPYPWQPSIVDVQIIRIGNILNIAFPGEFTTMSGRRVITAVQSVAGNNYQVVMSGLANTYSSYIATTEEYGVQRYEGASTIYGPDTLPAYINQYIKLARALVNNQQIQPTGLQPPYLLPVQIQLVGPVLFDTPALGKQFGDVVMDVQPQYRRGQQVFVSFVAANPRNDRKQESSFLTVEMLYNNNWPVVAVDGNWETKFYWNRTDPVSGMSRAIIQWDIPMQQRAGEYRIRYFGSSKGLDGTITQFVGKSSVFQVTQ